MPLALQYSKDSGQTFEPQIGLDVADYTSNTTVCNSFWSIKDSKDNIYIFCGSTTAFIPAKIIKISNTGVKTVGSMLNLDGGVNNTGYVGSANATHTLSLSRDESLLFINCSTNNASFQVLQSIPTNFTSGNITPTGLIGATAAMKFAIYQDRYIWIASGSTVKIYDYTTKAELASGNISLPGQVIVITSTCCDTDANLYCAVNSHIPAGVIKVTYSGGNAISYQVVVNDTDGSELLYQKQLLIDRFGDLIILTNSGTASTLLKYSTSGILIDNINLSTSGILGEGKGGYGLQVYSHKNKTTGAVIDCYCYFGNELVSCRTAPTTAQGQPFGAITKIRKNGESTFGDDWGGDNNYSVRC